MSSVMSKFLTVSTRYSNDDRLDSFGVELACLRVQFSQGDSDDGEGNGVLTIRCCVSPASLPAVRKNSHSALQMHIVDVLADGQTRGEREHDERYDDGGGADASLFSHLDESLKTPATDLAGRGDVMRHVTAASRDEARGAG